MVVTREAKPDETGDIDSDAFLPTESGNFRVRVTVDDDGKEHDGVTMVRKSTALMIVLEIKK